MLPFGVTCRGGGGCQRGGGAVVGQLGGDGRERVKRATVHFKEDRVERQTKNVLQGLECEVQRDELENIDGDFEKEEGGG